MTWKPPCRDVQPTTCDWSTRVNHNTIMYRYWSCTQLHNSLQCTSTLYASSHVVSTNQSRLRSPTSQLLVGCLVEGARKLQRRQGFKLKALFFHFSQSTSETGVVVLSSQGRACATSASSVTFGVTMHLSPEVQLAGVATLHPKQKKNTQNTKKIRLV